MTCRAPESLPPPTEPTKSFCKGCGVVLEPYEAPDDTWDLRAVDRSWICPATAPPWPRSWLAEVAQRMRSGTDRPGEAEIYTAETMAMSVGQSRYNRPHRPAPVQRDPTLPPVPECCGWPMRLRPSGWSCRVG